MSETLRGRCFCGAVRFAAAGQPFQVSWCHCRDCRRQSGAPAVVWAGFRSDEVTFEGAPKRRQSSPHITRSFCAECGTPMTYEDDRLEERSTSMPASSTRPTGWCPTGTPT